MAEHRKFTSVICVKTGAKTVVKIELFPAEQWQESAQGRFRCRVNRRWFDGPDGEMVFLDMAQVWELAAKLDAGESVDLAPAPDLPRGTAVRVPTRQLSGEQLYEVSRTHTVPMRGHDGRWYVNVVLFDKGSVMVAVDTLHIKKQRR